MDVDEKWKTKAHRSLYLEAKHRSLSLVLLSFLQLKTVPSTSKWQNNATNLASQGPKPSGPKTLTMVRHVGSLHDPGPVGKSKEISFGEQSYHIVNGTAKETKKADSQLSAHNRGKAMLRYKEKRKTRRHDLILLSLPICLAILWWKFVKNISY